MNSGIAEITGDGIPAVVRLNIFEAALGEIECLAPTDFNPFGADALYRPAKPVRVLVKIF